MNSSASSISATQSETQKRCVSSFRRKPRMTYRSPSGDASFIIGPFSISASAIEQKSASSSPTLQPVTLKVSADSIQIATSTPPTKCRKYPIAPPLPLYHPLGRLALSLPPLDPASVGLPTPVRSDDSIRPRARRPAGKSREITVEDESALLPTANPILDVEVREKPSPRKRRAAAGSKRKRREADDGDATYPAKRSRMTRGSNQIIADEMPFESSILEVTPTPEPMSEVPEDRQPERRSTRSRGSVKRRDSSASEAPSLNSTGAIRLSQDREEPREEPIPMESEQVSDTVASKHQSEIITDEKEEGELSDDGLPVNS